MVQCVTLFLAFELELRVAKKRVGRSNDLANKSAFHTEKLQIECPPNWRGLWNFF